MRHPYFEETVSLLTRLQNAGFELKSVSDGFEAINVGKHSLDDIAVELTATDESILRVKKDGHSLILFLVYGNCPGELVCDYSWDKAAEDAGLDTLMEELTDAHYAQWST